MRVGICCFPSFGGSGVVASELALALAESGDEVHVVSSARPPRLVEAPGVHHHPVDGSGILEYGLFDHPPYTLALANRLAQVARDRLLDLIHVHYAAPHAVAALLAREMLAHNASGPRTCPVVTTVHGTDVTLVGAHPNYSDIVGWALRGSDCVTVPSYALQQEVAERFALDAVEVIPNFVPVAQDPESQALAQASGAENMRAGCRPESGWCDPRPPANQSLRRSAGAPMEPGWRDPHPPANQSVRPSAGAPMAGLRTRSQRSSAPCGAPDGVGPGTAGPSRSGMQIVHVSNFRPVKRVADVVAAFALVRRELPAWLCLVGDGPGRPAAESQCRELGIADDVSFVGNQARVEPILERSDLFLSASETESFGLASLEALACGVPVVATRTGGVPEVVCHDRNGLLSPVGDVEALAGSCIALLADPARREAFARDGRRWARSRFDRDAIVARYREIYRATLTSGGASAP